MTYLDLPEPPEAKVSPQFFVGAASPLWGYFGAAAAGGLAFWWMTRWARPVNLEALLGATSGAGAVLDDAVEVVEAAVATLEPLPEVIAEAGAEAQPEPTESAFEALAETPAEVALDAVETAPAPVADPVLETPVEAIEAAQPAPEFAPPEPSAPEAMSGVSAEALPEPAADATLAAPLATPEEEAASSPKVRARKAPPLPPEA